MPDAITASEAAVLTEAADRVCADLIELDDDGGMNVYDVSTIRWKCADGGVD